MATSLTKNIIATGLKYQTLYEQLSDVPEFRDFKKNTNSLKLITETIILIEKKSLQTLVSKTEEIYGPKLAEKIVKWAKKWTFPNQGKNEDDLPESFKFEALKWQRSYNKLSRNATYRKYCSMKDAFRANILLYLKTNSENALFALLFSNGKLSASALSKIFSFPKNPNTKSSPEITT